MTSVGEVVRGQPFSVRVFMIGYAVDPKGHVDSNYDLKITRPDGTSFFEHRGVELCVEDGMTKGHVELAHLGLDLSLDAPEPLGTYKISVEINDRVAKRSASTEDSLRLAEYPDPRPFKSKEELGAWMMGYNRAPTPVRLLDAVASASAVELFGDDVPNYALRSFLGAVCRDNPFLQALLLQRFPKLDHVARLAALELLVAAPYDAKPFLAAASDDERKAGERLLKGARPDPLEGAIRDPGQLDELWGMFFASGRFAPIERLAKALSLDEQLDGKEKDAATTVLEGAARWSLKSNLRMPRVRPYCEWMLEHDRLDDQDAAQLKKLLEG
jgi:hypothetical protein